MGQSLSTFSFHDFLHKNFDIFLAVPVFGCICNIIRLYQDLPIQAVNFLKSVMVTHKEGNSVNLRLCHSGIREKRFYQGNAFLLLMFSVGVSVFLTAERACNVVCDGSRFQNVLRF